MAAVVLMVFCAAATGVLMRRLVIFIAAKTTSLDPKAVVEVLASGGLSLLFSKKPAEPRA